MQKELDKLNLKKNEHQKIPLGISTIFHKKIVPAALEEITVLRNYKYRKVDFMPHSSPKPVSKILTPKENL